MLAIACLLVTVIVVGPGSEQAEVLRDMARYLPSGSELERWQPKGNSQIFVGEDLYELINGGAVVYYEYGFKQVIVQEYENSDGESIDLELYEMDNSTSAYGIYTFQSGEGDEIELGSDAICSEYYLHFWKDVFFVRLMAFDSREYISRGLLTIAKAVDRKIKNKGQRPALCNLLVIEGLAPSRITYLKGNLALSNIYHFAADDIFGLREGVVGYYGEFSVFVFKYENVKKSRNQYQIARGKMSTNPRFENFTDHNDECSMIDNQAAAIRMRVYRNYIFVYTGADEKDPQTIFYQIENNLR